MLIYENFGEMDITRLKQTVGVKSIDRKEDIVLLAKLLKVIHENNDSGPYDIVTCIIRVIYRVLAMFGFGAKREVNSKYEECLRIFSEYTSFGLNPIDKVTRNENNINVVTVKDTTMSINMYPLYGYINLEIMVSGELGLSVRLDKHYNLLHGYDYIKGVVIQ